MRETIVIKLTAFAFVAATLLCLATVACGAEPPVPDARPKIIDAPKPVTIRAGTATLTGTLVPSTDPKFTAFMVAGVHRGCCNEAGAFFPRNADGTFGPAAPIAADGEDALDEVNRQRAARGLYPYRRCPLLTVAAAACARYRANHGIHGHTNDFAFVPAGCHCAATGAEGSGSHGPGWVPADGFGACAVFDSYREAGAAWVTAPNGQMYCSLFVR
jgi:hypothetical protein